MGREGNRPERVREGIFWGLVPTVLRLRGGQLVSQRQELTSRLLGGAGAGAARDCAARDCAAREETPSITPLGLGGEGGWEDGESPEPLALAPRQDEGEAPAKSSTRKGLAPS